MALKPSLVSWRGKMMLYDFITDEIKPREVRYLNCLKLHNL